MATTTKKIYRGNFPASYTSVYVVPPATTTVVTNIAVCNQAGSAQTFNIWIAGIPIQSGATIAANTTAYIDLKQVMTTGEDIQIAGSTVSISLHISGVEIV
jgi:hypothetical protein